MLAERAVLGVNSGLSYSYFSLGDLMFLQRRPNLWAVEVSATPNVGPRHRSDSVGRVRPIVERPANRRAASSSQASLRRCVVRKPGVTHSH
jgi:hypothetical protein